MLINNIDASNYKAVLLTKDIQTSEVIIFDDWLRQSISPLYLGRQEKYKQIKIQLSIKDADDESCLNDISNLVKQLEVCTIKFDNLSYYYDCLIVNKSHRRIIDGWYTLDVELKSNYAYKAALTETMNHVNTISINVQGNSPTPVIVTVTVLSNYSYLTLTGFGEDPITINNLTANVPVVIDGEANYVLQSGLNKFPDMDMWNFPILEPGAITITSTASNCVITMQYKPRYI
jgi:phage-related protein